MSEELRILPVREFDSFPTLRDVAAVFFRHRGLFVATFLVIVAAGIAYATLAPSYRAEMKVLVTRGRIDPAVTPTETAAPLLDRQEVTEEELNSEAELLRDDDVLRQVVIETGLADRTPWLEKLRKETQEQRIAHAIKRLARKLEVQPVRKSQLIAISYKSSDPALAAAVLKSLIRVYLAKQVEIRRPNNQQAFFDEQMKQSRRGLESAQSELVRFTRTHKVASATLERDLTLQKLSDAQAADLALQSSVVEAAARIRSLDDKLRELPERRVTQIRNTDNFDLQGKLKAKLLELELQRTQLLTRFQPSYRLVEEVDRQISQTKAAIEGEDLKPLRDETTDDNPDYSWARSERIKNMVELQALERKEKLAREQVAAYRQEAEKLGEGVVIQSDLESKVKAAEDKYLLYANKREEARIGDALDANGILNVTLAEAPRVPALPLWPLWTATCLSVAGAGLVSTGTVFAADYLDPSFRTPDDVVRVLGAPVLVSLPIPGRQVPRILGEV